MYRSFILHFHKKYGYVKVILTLWDFLLEKIDILMLKHIPLL